MLEGLRVNTSVNCPGSTMSQRELMRIQLDQLCWENEQLQAKNARLRDNDRHGALPVLVTGVEAEVAKCLEEQQQLERDQEHVAT